MKLPHYQVFGSPSSQDLDVVFFVENLTSIKDSHQLGKRYGQLLKEQLATPKDVNVNLAILGEQGHLVSVYKGTTDELNNALMETYSYHPQQHAQHISQALPRDVGLKALRCGRVVLSFLSRTSLRVEVKEALRGDFRQKNALLEQIELVDFSTLGKHGNLVTFYKTASFQLGQTLALADGVELYTKESIAEHFSDLAPYLQRQEGVGAKVLQRYLHQFTTFANKLMPTMFSLYEYEYQHHPLNS